MRISTSKAPVVGLLLLAPLATALTTTGGLPTTASVTPRATQNSISNRPELSQGRVDAPVDGKDGKPHQGPFVDTGNRGGTAPGDKNSLKSAKGAAPIALKGKPVDTTIDEFGNKIPESNNGVMDDKARIKAKEGSITGLEGGVSERERQRKAEEARTGAKSEGSPISPEEQPPLPHSEEEKMKAKGMKAQPDSKDSQVDKSAKEPHPHDDMGLEKPHDLPERPYGDHSIPGPGNKGRPDTEKGTSSDKFGNVNSGVAGEAAIISPLHSFMLAVMMITFSEIGDKTFLVAALMAMKHDRMVVFTAAASALLTMTVLSAVLGHAVPTLIPKKLTSYAASVLFFAFGAKLLKEGLAMDPNEGVADEMREVEQEISEKESEAMRNTDTTAGAYALEGGYSRKSRSTTRVNSPPRSPSSSPEPGQRSRTTKSDSRRKNSSTSGNSGLQGVIDGLHNLSSLLFSPAWVQTFIMTFLGEWGDRSQIATIAMAARQDYWWVTLGATLGHIGCTGVAVLGGRAVAGKVSMRVVTIGGAVAFLVFGVIYLVEGIYS